MARFNFWESGKPIPDGLPDNVEQAGKLIGWYDNASDDFRDNVVVTENGILVTQQAGWFFVPYTAMKRIAAPEKGTQACHVAVELEQARRLEVPIGGRDKAKGTRDVFEFVRFLQRVQGDLAEAHNPTVSQGLAPVEPPTNVNYETKLQN